MKYSCLQGENIWYSTMQADGKMEPGDLVVMSGNNTVKKYVDGLVEKRLITTEPTSVITKKGEKRNGNLLYTIRPIQEAVEYHYEQQMIRLNEEIMRQNTIKKLAEYDRKHPKVAV